MVWTLVLPQKNNIATLWHSSMACWGTLPVVRWFSHLYDVHVVRGLPSHVWRHRKGVTCIPFIFQIYPHYIIIFPLYLHLISSLYHHFGCIPITNPPTTRGPQPLCRRRCRRRPLRRGAADGAGTTAAHGGRSAEFGGDDQRHAPRCQARRGWRDMERWGENNLRPTRTFAHQEEHHFCCVFSYRQSERYVEWSTPSCGSQSVSMKCAS